jgi:ribonuclease D
MTETLHAPVLVQDVPGLRSAVAQLGEAEVLSLDTEFIRTDTYYPRLGLMQLSDGQRIWLIDPLVFSRSDLNSLIELLTDQSIVKVIHSCSEDLEVLRYALGTMPEPLFDTQIAAAFVGLGYSLSYQALVRKLLEIDLHKHETRSNWLRRPLSQAQLTYASEDVRYLGPIYEILTEQLINQSRISWLQDDMARLLSNTVEETPVEEYYLRVKGAWKLDGAGLMALKKLCIWRETQAREMDLPRGRVVPDKDLMQIAAKKIRQVSLLADDESIHPRSTRVYGKKLVAIVNEALIAGQSDHPPPLPKPVPKQYGSILKHCKLIVKNRATAMTIAPEILARKADLTYLVQSSAAGHPRLSPHVEDSWRKSVVGKDLLDYMREVGVSQT